MATTKELIFPVCQIVEVKAIHIQRGPNSPKLTQFNITRELCGVAPHRAFNSAPTECNFISPQSSKTKASDAMKNCTIFFQTGSSFCVKFQPHLLSDFRVFCVILCVRQVRHARSGASSAKEDMAKENQCFISGFSGILSNH